MSIIIAFSSSLPLTVGRFSTKKKRKKTASLQKPLKTKLVHVYIFYLRTILDIVYLQILFIKLNNHRPKTFEIRFNII
ncbi:unnamed protein product [Rhizophagus irregularis]|nr:unnamed protein product [Rhizophagus irregularis]